MKDWYIAGGWWWVLLIAFIAAMCLYIGRTTFDFQNWTIKIKYPWTALAVLVAMILRLLDK